MRTYDGFFEYSVGMNIVFLTGYVVDDPQILGKGAGEFIWFRLAVPNPDYSKQWLFISVRSRAQLGHTIWENVHKDDVVAVVGRIYSGSKKRDDANLNAEKQFSYVIADRVSGCFPVQLEKDPRYVRVRTDLWNRIAALVPECDARVLPPAARRDLLALFGKKAGWEEDVEDVQVDQKSTEHDTEEP